MKHYIYHFKNGSWKKELIKIETEFYRIFVKLNFKSKLRGAFCILESDTIGILDMSWLNFQVDNLHKISSQFHGVVASCDVLGTVLEL